MAYDATLTGSVRANLVSLQNTQSAIDKTNTRLNTGKKVSSVLDDAIAFFSAKALDERAADFDDRKAAIDQSISAINAALTATNSVDNLLKQLKGIVTTVKTASAVERGALQTQFNTVKNQIDQLVADATYQGTNLVSNSTTRLDTQFSERSTSRLVVTGRRLSTYQTRGPDLALVNVTSLTGDRGSNVLVRAGATGVYYVAGVQSTAGYQAFGFLRYDTTDASTTDVANNTSQVLYLGNISANLSQTYDPARDMNDASHLFQTQFSEVSGLNVFLASQVFIVADAAITGSLVFTTVSTGTLWSAAAFDPATGAVSDQFSEAMNLVLDGIEASIRQTNGAAKALASNVAILNTRLEFTKAYVNVQKEGAGKLVLADTSEEGASLVSLQTRQQLGIQALAFAGQSEQAVLRLFR